MKLNLPSVELKSRSIDGITEIWDEFRKKYVVLTPEEWVRQHFLYFMVEQLGYPKALLKVEFEIKYNGLKKRPDIVAFDSKGDCLVVVECKSAKVKLNQAVFEQVAVYNNKLKAKYIVITNGLEHFCCEQNDKTGTLHFVQRIPEYVS